MSEGMRQSFVAHQAWQYRTKGTRPIPPTAHALPFSALGRAQPFLTVCTTSSRVSTLRAMNTSDNKTRDSLRPSAIELTQFKFNPLFRLIIKT